MPFYYIHPVSLVWTTDRQTELEKPLKITLEPSWRTGRKKKVTLAILVNLLATMCKGGLTIECLSITSC